MNAYNPLMISGRSIALPLVNEADAVVSITSVTELLTMIFHHLFKGENIEKVSFVSTDASFVKVASSQLFVVLEEISPGYGNLFLTSTHLLNKEKLEDRYFFKTQLVAAKTFLEKDQDDKVEVPDIMIVTGQDLKEEYGDIPSLYPFVPYTITVENGTDFEDIWKLVESNILTTVFDEVKKFFKMESQSDSEVPFPPAETIRRYLKEFFDHFSDWENKPALPLTLKYEIHIVPHSVVDTQETAEQDLRRNIRYNWRHRAILEGYTKASSPLTTIPF